MKINPSAEADKKATPVTSCEVKPSGGHCTVKDGRLCFVSDKNIVFIREHFADSGLTPDMLVENMIRYESEHSPSEKYS